jgi:SAM-dependent methyltransferase
MSTSSLLTVPSFLLKSLAAQTLAAATCVIIWPLVLSTSATVFVASIVALSAATFVQLPASWRIINCFLPPAALTALALEIPSTLWLLPLVGVVAIYGPALLTRVPYYPTPKAAYGLLLAELPTNRPFRFLDIGCGFGDLLLFLAQHRPNGTFVGIELGPLPCLVARLRSLNSHNRNVRIYCRDMWGYQVSEYDYVYTFLSPAVMERIGQKVSREMTAGATFISNSFPLPADASEELQIRDERGSKLYIYRIAELWTLRARA